MVKEQLNTDLVGFSGKRVLAWYFTNLHINVNPLIGESKQRSK